MKYFLILFFLVLIGCVDQKATSIPHPEPTKRITEIKETSLVILGTVQDAGSPHIACKKECCSVLFESPDASRKVVSLGLIDPENNKSYLFEATPDITTQVKMLNTLSSNKKELPDGIFLTHAHIGHYTGLMYLGKEATNADKVPVFAMPGMKNFLENNGPWSQLVTNENISISEIFEAQEIALSTHLKVIPFKVPHRDEYSETVGYKIVGPNKSALFIPDIDKWEKWDTSIVTAISEVDYAFLDATFYDGDEIARDISEIPHPFIIESMDTFENLPSEEKDKIHFIHFNHTNPVLNEESDAYKKIMDKGFHVATINDVVGL